MNRLTCPIWECLKPEQLTKLIMLQWKLYGLKLKCLERDPEYTIESLEEIAKIMVRKPKGRPYRS